MWQMDSTMITGAVDRLSPPAPCAVLRERALVELGLTQAQLSAALGVSRPHVNMILKGRCGITADLAIRLGHVLGTAPQYWLQLRSDFELHQEIERMRGVVEKLPRLVPAPSVAEALSLAA